MSSLVSGTLYATLVLGEKLNLKDDRMRILIVEDDENDQLLIKRVLSKSDIVYDSLCVDNREGFILQLDTFRPQLILCDYSIPHFGALDALNLLRERASQIPMIIVTGALSDELAVECLKNGAIDYILKDKIVRLPSAIKLAIELVDSRREKLEAELRLRASEMQLKTVTDVLPASLTYFRNNFEFEFANKISDDWFEKKITGEHIQSVLGQRVYEKIKKEIPALAKGEQLSFECLLPGKKIRRFINIIIVPDFDGPLGVKGFVCLITDITERKNYENELKEAKRAADEANSAKTQFLANMSHEIRTPLNVIMGLSELLISDPDAESDERTLWLKKIVRNSEHLKKVIDEILDLSKIEAGKIQIQLQRFSVNELVAQLKSILWPLAREKNLELKFEIADSIPEFIYSDPAKLRHILLNVLDNAIKFSNEGPIIFTAKLEIQNPNPVLNFLIRDLGIGMTQDQAVHLFEPFTQVDNSMTRRFGGTGLGLALARQLARALGGDVHLTSSVPGRGSTFSVTVDAGPVKDSEVITSFQLVTEHNVKSPEPQTIRPDLSNMKVLVVEDSVDNQLYIMSFLKKEGVKVEVASDGQEGMAKALSGNYDLILMDIQMPVMDGYTATSRLRKGGYCKPILAFTAHTLQNENDRYSKAGFDGFISKPVRKSELLQWLSKFRQVNQAEM